MEDNENELNHFSHEKHPLILGEVVKRRNVTCYGCREQILDPQAYICSSDCNFFLHQKCAKLPMQITHPSHRQHPLDLLKEPIYPDKTCECRACDQQGWKSFTYHCSSCQFDLDVLCATAERRLDHKGHDHPLIFQRKPATFLCSACCTKAEDSSYFCGTCPFWIHKSCALLPERVKHKHHKHELSLAYCLPHEFRRFLVNCFGCRRKIRPNYWVYYCGPCRYYIHLKCLKPQKSKDEEISESETQELVEIISDKLSIINLSKEEAIQKLLAFTFPHEVGKTESSILHPGHDHLLFLSENMQTQNENVSSGGGTETLLCDGCIDPIIAFDPHYRCISCRYYLHVTCAHLPTQSPVPIPMNHKHRLVLDPTVANAAGGATCHNCQRFGNGLFYACASCCIYACLRCVAISRQTQVVHKVHNCPLSPFPLLWCNACGYQRDARTSSGDPHLGIHCYECDFYLHYDCALLPHETRHRWDKHPLSLIFPPYFEHPEDFYCEVCEIEMNPHLRMYHCRECDRSFHPDCLPLIRFRNTKLGRKIHVDDHSHPLTCVIEGSYKSFCKDCGGRVYDDLAFVCHPCGFRLCRFCAFKRARIKLSDNKMQPELRTVMVLIWVIQMVAMVPISKQMQTELRAV